MLTVAERERYRRQLSLAGFGERAQERLKGGHVLVIGAGGLGCPALTYLVAAGVGRITVVDPDRVDRTNLQRQILYGDGDVGQLKAEVAARRLRAQNPLISIVGVAERFRRDNALELVRTCDVVVDGSDNFATRYLVNDACVIADRPFVYGAIQGFEGQVSVFNWRGGPTYRCLFPTAPAPELVPSCAEAGVLGILPGIVGTCQAGEAIKLLTGIGAPMSGRLLLWNMLTGAVQTFALARDPRTSPIVELPLDVEPPVCRDAEWEVDVEELRAILHAGRVQLLDVRDADERLEDAIMPSVHVPLGWLEQADGDSVAGALQPEMLTVVYCASGVRSRRAVAILRGRHGFREAHSLRGGMAAWRLAQGAG